jgi:hypothetical protein
MAVLPLYACKREANEGPIIIILKKIGLSTNFSFKIKG